MTSTTVDVGLAERSAALLFAAATRYAEATHGKAAVSRGVVVGTGVSPTGNTVSRTGQQPSATSLQSVLDCIKRAESGNYTEHSHINDGSGAYQAIPGTWRAWSARAGYPGYAYEYLAPPNVQDAVVVFMLRNGGAHNWDPKYGRDSCTVGLP